MAEAEQSVRVQKDDVMSADKWLDEYLGQTTGELIALELAYRVDSIVIVFEQAIGQKSAQVGNAGLSEEERVVLAVEAFEREVNDGGYDQFFVNPSHEHAPHIVRVLERIGCPAVAELTQQAIDVLGIAGPLTIEAIARVMERPSDERDKRLAACDRRYYEVAGDLAGPLFEFIKSNRDKIEIGRRH